ncbi:MAG: bi-domain-containing oxidoreductase [Cyanobacteria bacterium P01_H01_bin.74]
MMWQIYQESYLSSSLRLEEVPEPSLQGEGILVQNQSSLISAGTERAIVSFARKGLISKIRSQPERLQLLLSKMKRNGIISTIQQAKKKLSSPIPLGYSSAGFVTENNTTDSNLGKGCRVACAGAKYANHASVVYIPKNLSVPLPDAVSFTEGSFVAPGAIAMHGVRLAKIGLGETVVVIGLGLIGQLTVQLVTAQGGQAIGIDFDPYRLDLAKTLGASHVLSRSDDRIVETVSQLTRGLMADHVIIAAATQSNDPVMLAGELCKDKGQVVVLGDVKMNIPRSVYYKKELAVVVSRSYGPGRYDSSFEEGGQNYPPSYVRWTQRDNMQCFLDLIAQKKISVMPLVQYQFDILDAVKAFDLLTDPTASPQPMGIVLNYTAVSDRPSVAGADDSSSSQSKSSQFTSAQATAGSKPESAAFSANASPSNKDTLGISLIGAGNFMKAVLLPAIQSQPKMNWRGVINQTGLSAKSIAQKEGFAFCSTSTKELWADTETDVVFIATPHDSHTALVVEALSAGKHIFVEKPLATSPEELAACIKAFAANPEQSVMVGFNRRFAPLSVALKTELAKYNSASPHKSIAIHYRVFAGAIPAENWVHAHGGRLIGEVCHFVDWCHWCCESVPVSVFASGSGELPNQDLQIVIRFANGATASIAYLTQPDMQSVNHFGKESIAVTAPGFIAELNDFKQLTTVVNGKKQVIKNQKQDKGHLQEVSAFFEGIKTGKPAIEKGSLISVTQTGFAIQESLTSGRAVMIS